MNKNRFLTKTVPKAQNFFLLHTQLVHRRLHDMQPEVKVTAPIDWSGKLEISNNLDRGMDQ